MGKPDRIEPSGYGYDWWVYFEDQQFMVGVTEDKSKPIVYSGTILQM